MATLTALKFDTADGAQQMESLLLQLQQQQLIQVHDAAIVSWPVTAKKPKTTQLNSLTGAGALGGAFWGLLFGMLFFVPLLGMAVGAAMGALTGSLSDVGIDDKFINQVRSNVTPGTSAIFLLTSNAVTERVQDAIRQQGLKPELIASNLSSEQEAKLAEAFAETDAEVEPVAEPVAEVEPVAEPWPRPRLSRWPRSRPRPSPRPGPSPRPNRYPSYVRLVGAGRCPTLRTYPALYATRDPRWRVR